MADGTTFSITSNHMLLTTEGFVAASLLMPGDNVLDCGVGQRISGSDPDHDREPVAIDEIVGTLSVGPSVVSRTVPVSSKDLHGDGRFCEGNIHVVRPNGLLWDRFDSDNSEPISQIDLHGRGHRKALLPTLGHLESMFLAFRDATDGGVGSVRERKALLRSRLSHPEIHGVASATDWNSGFDENPTDHIARTADQIRKSFFALAVDVPFRDAGFVNAGRTANQPLSVLHVPIDASLFEPRNDRRGRDAVRLRDTLGALSGNVTLNRIRQVESFHYVGPVYDVETTSSLYAIESGIVSSNCRCRTEVVAPGATSTIPFPDYRRTLEHLPIDRRVKVVTPSVYALIRAGLITWDDVVLADRVRPLAEIMGLYRISVKRAIAAGVMPGTAKRAADVPKADAATWAARARESLESMLRSAADHAAHPDSLLSRLEKAAKGLAGGLGNVAALALPATMADQRKAQAADLAALLMGDRKTRRLTAEERVVVAAELGDPAASSVDAMLAAVAERRRNGGMVSEAVASIDRKYSGDRNRASPGR